MQQQQQQQQRRPAPQGPFALSPNPAAGSPLHNSDPNSMNYSNGSSPHPPQHAAAKSGMVRAKSARWAPDLRSRLASSNAAAGPPPTPPPSHRHSVRSDAGSSSSLASNSQSTRSSLPPQEVVAGSASHDGSVGHSHHKGGGRHNDRNGGAGSTDGDGGSGNDSTGTATIGNKSNSFGGEMNESMSELQSMKSTGDVSSAPSVKQTTVVNAMTAAMDNPQLFDIVLVGRATEDSSDVVVTVPAAKFVLASRNAGLQALLYEDPTATEVYVGEYTEDCLQALIEYCHTGEIVRSPLRVDPKSDRGVRGWAQLSHLSNQYDFEALGEEADNMLNAILEFSVGLICSVYDEALAGRFTTMEQMAMSMIQESPTQVLILGNVPGVGYLSPPALEQLLMHELYVNDMTRILILTRWIEWVGRYPENVKVALLCASNIPLDTMDPNFLLTDVKDSGIFDVREVHRAAGISPPPSPGSDLPSPGADGESQYAHQGGGANPQQQQHHQTPLYDEDYLYSPDGSLMEDSPMSENYKPKKEKRKKSKKDGKSSLMDGQCYQLTPDGIVIVCSTDTPKHLPNFHYQAQPQAQTPTQQHPYQQQQSSRITGPVPEQRPQHHPHPAMSHHLHHQPHTPGAPAPAVGGARQ